MWTWAEPCPTKPSQLTRYNQASMVRCRCYQFRCLKVEIIELTCANNYSGVGRRRSSSSVHGAKTLLSKNSWRVVVGTAWCTERLLMVCERLVSHVLCNNAGTKSRNWRLNINKSEIKKTLQEVSGVGVLQCFRWSPWTQVFYRAAWLTELWFYFYNKQCYHCVRISEGSCVFILSWDSLAMYLTAGYTAC